MAKYSYPYACGHGNGIVNLIGKTADRERKLAWYADNFVCPDCYKKQKEEEDATAEKTASLHVAVLDKVWFAVQVHGQIQANKDALQKLGYRWEDEIDGGLLAILKMPKLALQKRMVAASIEQMAETAKQWRQELDGLGYKVTKGISHFDFNAARLHFEYQAKKSRRSRETKTRGGRSRGEKTGNYQKTRPQTQAAGMVCRRPRGQTILEREILRRQKKRLARLSRQ